MKQYAAKGVEPFGVNPADVGDHARYAAKLKLPFPLLSDAAREAATAYGAVKPDGLKIQRSVVIVDRNGTVAFAARGAPGAAESLAGLS
jgi:peroxiredoxin